MTSAASARIGLTNVATERPPVIIGFEGKPDCLCVDADNPLCPIHGDVRDTGFVIDSKDDYITAIEDAIEELDHDNR